MNIKSFLVFTQIIFGLTILHAQVPQGFNYQAVIRDANGEIVANELISLRFTIFSSPIGGEPLTTQYAESHDALTNEFGMVSLRIGSGQVSIGDFANLGWNEEEYYLQTEVDLGGGWLNTGMQQLLSVPFAVRAELSMPK